MVDNSIILLILSIWRKLGIYRHNGMDTILNITINSLWFYGYRR